MAVTGPVFDLLRQQRAAVERYLRDVLVARGVDPEDRTEGWEGRARAALADIEAVDTFDMSEDYPDDRHHRVPAASARPLVASCQWKRHRFVARNRADVP